MEARQHALLGVWDLGRFDPKLGSLLIFFEELLLVAQREHLAGLEVAFVLGRNAVPRLFLKQMLHFLPGCAAVRYFENSAELTEFLEAHRDQYRLWPASWSDVPGTGSHYGSTLAVQELARDQGIIPLIASKEAENLAWEWLQAHPDPAGSWPVAVHLKNQSRDPESNADPENWRRLFVHGRQQNPPARFLLIGNDPVSPLFDGMDHVIHVQPAPGGVMLDLALILASRFFMGMASGPCNLALFSYLPCLIWKHPDHHAAAMERELDDRGGFSFSVENQHFFRRHDEAVHLIEQFSRLAHQLGHCQ